MADVQESTNPSDPPSLSPPVNTTTYSAFHSPPPAHSIVGFGKPSKPTFAQRDLSVPVRQTRSQTKRTEELEARVKDRYQSDANEEEGDVEMGG